MNINEYKVLRDERVKSLFKSGADILEMRKTFGIDEDVIRSICEGIIQNSKPKKFGRGDKKLKENDA